jgi:hypothetical protein
LQSSSFFSGSSGSLPSESSGFSDFSSSSYSDSYTGPINTQSSSGGSFSSGEGLSADVSSSGSSYSGPTSSFSVNANIEKSPQQEAYSKYSDATPGNKNPLPDSITGLNTILETHSKPDSTGSNGNNFNEEYSKYSGDSQAKIPLPTSSPSYSESLSSEDYSSHVSASHFDDKSVGPSSSQSYSASNDFAPSPLYTSSGDVHGRSSGKSLLASAEQGLDIADITSDNAATSDLAANSVTSGDISQASKQPFNFQIDWKPFLPDGIPLPSFAGIPDLLSKDRTLLATGGLAVAASPDDGTSPSNDDNDWLLSSYQSRGSSVTQIDNEEAQKSATSTKREEEKQMSSLLSTNSATARPTPIIVVAVASPPDRFRDQLGDEEQADLPRLSAASSRVRTTTVLGLPRGQVEDINMIPESQVSKSNPMPRTHGLRVIRGSIPPPPLPFAI